MLLLLIVFILIKKLFTFGLPGSDKHFVGILSGDSLNKMTWHGRSQYLQALMAAGIDQTQMNSFGNNNKCNAAAKFDRCCWQSNFWCPFYLFCDADDMRAVACQFPPGFLAWNCQMCLGFFVNEYIKCFSDAFNNRDCCYNRGVPKECSYWGETRDCGDYCDGTHSYEADNIRYQCCIYGYYGQISDCNKQAADMNKDTAAVRDNFCQRDCKPPWPEYCKKNNE